MNRQAPRSAPLPPSDVRRVSHTSGEPGPAGLGSRDVRYNPDAAEARWASDTPNTATAMGVPSTAPA